MSAKCKYRQNVHLANGGVGEMVVGEMVVGKKRRQSVRRGVKTIPLFSNDFKKIHTRSFKIKNLIYFFSWL